MIMRQITLGEFIYELEKHDADTEIRFDFGAHPAGFDSYRGYYDQIALEYKSDYNKADEMTVGALLTLAKAARGEEFTGYKGGQYVMLSTTELWASNYGVCSRMAIVGVTDHDWIVIINTWFQG